MTKETNKTKQKSTLSNKCLKTHFARWVPSVKSVNITPTRTALYWTHADIFLSYHHRKDILCYTSFTENYCVASFKKLLCGHSVNEGCKTICWDQFPTLSMGPRSWPQVTRTGGRHLGPPSHLAGSVLYMSIGTVFPHVTHSSLYFQICNFSWSIQCRQPTLQHACF